MDVLIYVLQLESMDEAEKCVEDVKRIQRLLKAETGLLSITSADNQVDGKFFIYIVIIDI